MTVSRTSIYSRSVARKIRVVIAKPGLDGHDRGAKIIARALRDAGMEVIYTGLHQTPEQIVETALQEDADAVGISILSGAHMTLVPKIVEGLRANGLEEVLVVVGGTIPKPDVTALKEQGVAEIFTPGAPVADIVDFLREREGPLMPIDVETTTAARARHHRPARGAERVRSLELLGELHARLDELARDDEARVVVLTGAGDRAFAAGADIKYMQRARRCSRRGEWGELGQATALPARDDAEADDRGDQRVRARRRLRARARLRPPLRLDARPSSASRR